MTDLLASKLVSDLTETIIDQDGSSLQLLKTMKQALLKDTADEIKQCAPKRIAQSTKTAKKGPQNGKSTAAEGGDDIEGSGGSCLLFRTKALNVSAGARHRHRGMCSDEADLQAQWHFLMMLH